MNARGLPLVLVPACNRMLGEHPFHVVGAKYAAAVRLAGCRPLVVPDAGADEVDALLDLVDGVLLTGSPSNVHPDLYGEGVADPALPLDPARDALTLPLIERALARAVPLLAICRGAQEINVARGGSLHQALHELPGRDDHRAAAEVPVEMQYGPAHEVQVVAGGRLEAIVGSGRFAVNSLHGQAVARLAPGLAVEAVADDGTVEAFSVDGARAFALAVQWHPEWRAANNPVSRNLLAAFGRACTERRAQRDHGASR